MRLNNGVDLKYIPYRGSTPGVVDLIGGQLASMLTPQGDFLADQEAGKLRSLATSGKRRPPSTREIPTFIEAGFPDLMVEEWVGFYGSAKTPANIQKLTHSKYEMRRAPSRLRAFQDDTKIVQNSIN